MPTAAIEIRPLSGHIGAEILGVDVGVELDDATFSQIHDALLEHQVVVLRDQKLEHVDQIQFARRFGELDIHPIAIGLRAHPEVIRVFKPADESACFGTGWHTDNTFFEAPSRISVLYGVTIPPYGGDTLWSSMEAAYEALSSTMREMLDGLVAVHSASRAYDPRTTGEAKYRGEAAISYRYSDEIYSEVEHPVVRVHPETGRRSLFVNPMFTQRIIGLEEHESRALLEMLYAHATRPDFTCRLRWQPGTLAIWDNRNTQHYAMDDYRPFERLMYRVSVAGEAVSGEARPR